MSEGMRFKVAPLAFNGGSVGDYAVKILGNGGLGSVFLPTGRQVPHVLATAAKDSLASAAALPLQAVSAVTGVLNLGVGVYNAYQIGQLRREVEAVTGALASASDERRSLHAETLWAIGQVYTQGELLFQQQKQTIMRIDEMFELAAADRVAERMIGLERARHDLALSPDHKHAFGLADAANKALNTLDASLIRAGRPLTRLPLVALAVQAYTAKTDAYLVLDALGVGADPLKVAEDSRRMALQLTATEQSRALGAKFGENLDAETGLWLPDAYFAMYHAVSGTGWLGKSPALVTPTRGLRVPSERSPRPGPESRIWEPVDGVEKLWSLTPGLRQVSAPVDGVWIVALPTVLEAADALGISAESANLDRILDAVEIRQTTAPVLLDDTAALSVALAPLAADTAFLINPEEVLWAYLESLLLADGSSNRSRAQRLGPLGAFGGYRLGSADVGDGLTRAVGDAMAYLPESSETRSDLELLLVVHRALTLADTTACARILESAFRCRGDAAPMVALDVASLASEEDLEANGSRLLQSLESVASNIDATSKALSAILLPANDQQGSEQMMLWVEHRLALDAARLAVLPSLRARATRATRGLSNPWGSIFKAAHAVAHKPRERETTALVRNALELIRGLETVSEQERSILKELLVPSMRTPRV